VEATGRSETTGGSVPRPLHGYSKSATINRVMQPAAVDFTPDWTVRGHRSQASGWPHDTGSRIELSLDRDWPLQREL